MRVFAGLAALATCCAMPTQVLAQDGAQDAALAGIPAGELALARDIIDNGFPPETRMGMFDEVIGQMLDQMRQAFPNLDQSPAMARVFDDHADRVQATSVEVLSRHIDPMMESLVVAYADRFTLEELQGLHAFIMSPAGYGFLARTAEVNGHPAFAAANQAYMQEYLARMPQLMEALREDLERVQAEAQ